MKNLAFTAIILLFSITTFAQKNIPAEVKAAFSKQYPEVKKVKWENEDGKFEAGFKQNKVECSVLMNSKGKIIETENEIRITDLSKSITDYVAKNYPNQNIKSAAKITDAEGAVTYEAEVKVDASLAKNRISFSAITERLMQFFNGITR